MKHKKNKRPGISKEVMDLVKRVEDHNISVRLEKGHFKSGHCFLKDQQTLILNKNQNNDILESFLVKFLEQYDQSEVVATS